MQFPPENPYASPPPIPPEPWKDRPVFYLATNILLLLAVTATFISMRYEGAARFTQSRQIRRQLDINENRESRPEVIAAMEVDVNQLRQKAWFWGMSGLALFVLAILSWIISARRREKHFSWVPAVALLMFYVMMQLII